VIAQLANAFVLEEQRTPDQFMPPRALDEE
jgi:hypothetical protein